MSIEQVIFTNLLTNEVFSRKVLPYLKIEYFSSPSDRVIYETIDDYFKKYNTVPSVEALAIDISNKTLNESTFKDSIMLVERLTHDKNDTTDIDWLIDNTEKFCQEKAIYNGIMKAISIIENKDKNIVEDKGAIPKILQDALAVTFDNSIGHDFIEDAVSRYDFYHNREKKVPFDIDLFNEITDGGFSLKTLNVYLAGVGVGKTMLMCHQAGYNLSRGHNVLYITMEMAEERIAERIDANLLDIRMDELKHLPRDIYERKIARLKEKTKGKLIIKEYPTAGAGSSHFRYLLNELKTKKNFVPAIIYIDYLNICCSSRLKIGSNVNSYTYIKSIAEELRGLAQEFNVPIVSATQVNRAGFTDSDFGMENTSESFGLPATVDFLMALISTDELIELNQIMCKQLKNRYDDLNRKKRFVIGVDKSKMRVYNCDNSAQDDLVDDRPVMDKTSFGSADNERSSPRKKFGKKDFEGFH